MVISLIFAYFNVIISDVQSTDELFFQSANQYYCIIENILI